jgi:anaerobic selenocysteine-containing dehydrogenase
MTLEVKASACPLDCPDGCSLDVSIDAGRVQKIAGSHLNPHTAGLICSKVRNFDHYLYHEGRLQTPLIREPGAPKGEARFRAASWDEALDLVAENMRSVRAEHGGEAIVPMHYGGSNGLLTEDCLDRALFDRLGASQLLMTTCAAPSGSAQMGLYGKMVGVDFRDYKHAQLIVVWGFNPHASGIHLAPIIKQAQAAGAKLVVIDPRRTKIAKAADLHLAPRPGTDLPLALAVAHWLFENGHADHAFLDEHCTRAHEFEMRASDWDLERAASVTGIDASVIEEFAKLYAESNPAVIRVGWGLERNRNGGSAVAAVIALPAVANKFGVLGGGFSGSQSGRIKTKPIIEVQQADTRWINMSKLGRALLDADDPGIHHLFVYNCNPVATMPTQGLMKKGLAREDLFTVVFDQVMTDTARWADVVLPATTFFEHHELRGAYGVPTMLASEPVVEPVGKSRPNYAVFADLLRRLDLWRSSDEDQPREMIERALEPEDLETLDRDGIIHPEFAQHAIQMVDVFPRTHDKKIQLVPPAQDNETPMGLYAYQEDPAEEGYPLALISPATERTISSSLGLLHTAIVPVLMNPEDAQARGLSDGQAVRIYNEQGEVLTDLKLTEDVKIGVTVLPKGLWSHNTRNGQTSNVLCPDSSADLGLGACYNDARVEIGPAEVV